MNPVRHERSETTGTRWLGEVPSHWQVIRLKNVADYWVSNVDKVPAEGEEPVRLCNYTDVYYHEHLHPNLDLMRTTATAAEIQRFHLQAEDVVITKDSEEWSDIAVPALVTDTAPDLVCGYHLAIVRPRPNRLYGPFLQRLFQAAGVNTQLQVSASGITRYSLPKSAIGGAVIPLPPMDEQRTIADFLDRETAGIEKLIEAKRNLLVALEEKKAATITQVISRGLDSCCSLRESGIPWIGRIPAHWGTRRLRHITDGITVGVVVNPSSYVSDDGVPFLLGGDVREFKIDTASCKRCPAEISDGVLSKSRLSAGDIVVVRVGYPGVAAVVPTELEGANCASMMIVRRDDRFVSQWLAYAINSRVGRDQVQLVQYGAAQKQYNISHAVDFTFPFPPLDEQKGIAAYLDRTTEAIVTVLETISQSISRLSEYRSALISAAVTGQIDIRNYRPQEAAALCQ